MGTPPEPHGGVESNVAAFILRPTITAPVGVANVQGAGDAPRSAEIPSFIQNKNRKKKQFLPSVHFSEKLL
jgi:hypothetical protein